MYNIQKLGNHLSFVLNYYSTLKKAPYKKRTLMLSPVLTLRPIWGWTRYKFYLIIQSL